MASALLIVATGLIALVTFGAAYYLVFPIFLDIQANPSTACLSKTQCVAIFDNMYDVMFMAFELMLAGIFFSMYMRAVRKDQTESYSSSSGGFEGF